MSNPYDIIQYRMPHKWAELIVKTSLEGIPLEEATKGWSEQEIDDFCCYTACGATLLQEDTETKEYKRPELSVEFFEVDEEGWEILEGQLTAVPKTNQKLQEMLSTKAPWD
jgi:hypothetical protein